MKTNSTKSMKSIPSMKSMKSIIRLTFLAALAFLLSACGTTLRTNTGTVFHTDADCTSLTYKSPDGSSLTMTDVNHSALAKARWAGVVQGITALGGATLLK